MKTCIQRLHELEKELGWEGEKEVDYSHLPTFHVTYTKKEIKKIDKENKKLKKKTKKKDKLRYYELLGTFDPWTREDIIRQFDDKNDAIRYMVSLSKRLHEEWTHEERYETPREYCEESDAIRTIGTDPLISSGNWDAWEEYTASHQKMSLEKLHKRRRTFVKRVKKERSKVHKKYKAFERYDPLFRMRKIDEEELKKSLKLLTKETMERRDRFLEQMQKAYSLPPDDYLITNFKDKSKAANKALNKYIMDMNKSSSYSDDVFEDKILDLEFDRKQIKEFLS